MKVLIGALASTILLAAAATAQTTTTSTPLTEVPSTSTSTTTAPTAPPPPSRCPALAEAPVLPDGAAANAAAMQAGNAAYQAWGTATQQVLACRRTEIQEMRAAETARTAEYNVGARTLNEVTTGWVAESTEFNTRQTSRRTSRGN